MSPVLTEKIRVRFNDCDFYRHVNNTVYLVYMDNAMTEFFRAIFGQIQNPDFQIHMVRLEVDYKNSATFDDELLIHTRIEKIGNTSMTLHQTITLESSGTLLVECRKIGVFLDAKGRNKVSVPEKILQFAGAGV